MADRPGADQPRRPWRVRPWLRAIHRDVGYLAVGLTIVYALSGLAVNHIADWDPNFVQVTQEFSIPRPLPDDDSRWAQVVTATAGVADPPLDVYRVDADRLDIEFADHTLHVDTSTGRVFDEGQEPRPFLRLANWLHLNRGKQAWTYFADAFAVALLFLAGSGLFMIPGRKGLAGRGAALALLGAAIPVAYLWWSGGP